MHEGTQAWILVLVLHCSSGLTQQDEVLANCNEDITLPCAVSKPGSTYHYMVWYKNGTAIIIRKNNDVLFYNESSPASLGVQDTLVLQNVQPSDNGYYQCYLAADVGQKDRQSFVSLTVLECVTVIPTWTTAGNKCHLKIVEVSTLWSLLGFSFIGMFNFIVCTIIVIMEVGSKELIGLVMKDLQTQETVLCKFSNQSYEVGNDFSLLLPEVGKSDCGHYRCTLWPPLGHYIQDGDYEYNPLDSACSRHYQQTMTLSGERTKWYMFNVPVILAVSVLFAAGNIAVVYLSCKKILQNKKAKQDMEYCICKSVIISLQR